MEIESAQEAGTEEEQTAIDGRAWCLRCDRESGYRVSKIEFLGNPVKASFFCSECGSRMHPEAPDRTQALRLQTGARKLRWGAAGSLMVMLLLPLILLALVVYFLWRLI